MELELELRWFRSARRHRVGKAHALQVIASVQPAGVPSSDDADARLVGIGADERGVELEIVALDLHDAVVVIHVMPPHCAGDTMSERPTVDTVADVEELHDDHGRVVDDAYVDAAVEDALAQVRGCGRPSLSVAGESPLLGVRLPHELDEAVRAAAEKAGASRSEWVRRALDDAVRRAG